MNRSVPVGEVRPFGDRALLIGVADPVDGRVLARAIARTPELGDAVEGVGGVATVMVSPGPVIRRAEAARITSPSSASADAVGWPRLRAWAQISAALSITSEVIGTRSSIVIA